MALAWPLHIFSLLLLCFTAASSGLTSTETLTLYELPNTNHNDAQPSSLAVMVAKEDHNEVAYTIIKAENWLRNNVLSTYPSNKITHIVVGHNLLCFPNAKNHNLTHIAMKNLHHALTRWGLEKHIKVSPSISSHCLTPNSTPISLLQTIVDFIHTTNSTYIINPNEPTSDQKIETLLNTHMEFLKKIGTLSSSKVYFIIGNHKDSKFTMRKLSIVIPPLPTPEKATSPSHNENNFPIARGPLPPLVGPTSSPPSPLIPYTLSPHPSHHNLPPCNPWPAPAPVPEVREREKLWCVAKPSVPAETLQEAMDFACGEGEAKCEEILPNGNCYYPDTLVAHASYAFNSYWQKTKRHGGTCSFGGTAMLINSDPSYLHCRFIVS